jgi:hypothetical protein
VIDPNFGLVENQNTGRKFGKDGQIEIIGWSGKYRSAKKYVLICKECAKDQEMFGEGYFSATLTNLTSGRIPCGCAKSHKRTIAQYAIEATRTCEFLGLKFIDWEGEFKDTRVKCKIECPVHGIYATTSLNSLINQQSGCRKCADVYIAKRFTKPDNQMADKFMSTGMFQSGTIFTRSDLQNKSGHKTFWNIECPQCGFSGTSHQSNLSVGKVPCECSYTTKMTEAYINIISDSGNDIAIKFGISSLSHRRLKTQGRYSVYDIRKFGVWTFPNFIQCREAENEVKQCVVSGILGKEEMPDGFTETTYTYNVDKVIQIYESNGGVRMNDK